MARTEPLNLRSFLLRIFLFLFISILVFLFCLWIGSTEIPPAKLITILFNNKDDSTLSKIIFEIRLPRVLLAAAVGGGLSVAGAVFQVILMNPLAEPYILGISSGGAFGAVLSILLGFTFWGTQLFAFLGAMLVISLVFLLGKRYGRIEPNTLLLSGVMIGAFFSAIILLMMTMIDSSFRAAIFWLIGNLSLGEYDFVPYIFGITFLISFILSLMGKNYNILSMGDETARSLGINSTLLNNFSYIVVSLMIGSIVSVSGIIGFVGLLIPHVSRLIFGLDNRIIIPVSYLLGASYLMIADTFARTIIAPSELPVGAITALLGAPIFIYLLRRKFNFA